MIKDSEPEYITKPVLSDSNIGRFNTRMQDIDWNQVSLWEDPPEAYFIFDNAYFTIRCTKMVTSMIEKKVLIFEFFFISSFSRYS